MKRREVVEQWARTYPRDSVALNYLQAVYLPSGEYEKTLEVAREELRLTPRDGYAVGDVVRAYMLLNRLEEAKAVLDEAFRQKVDQSGRHLDRYVIGFWQGDGEAMRREVEWFKGRPDEGDLRAAQAKAAAYTGRLGQARELFAQAVALHRRNGLEEIAAYTLLDEGGIEALLGNRRQAVERASD